MSSRKINIRNSFSRKKDLLDALDPVFLAMRSCCNCTMSGKICCIRDSSEKCVKCVQSDCNCNLAIFSVSIKQIYRKQMRLKKEMRDTRAKLSRLKKQLNFLENKKKEIIVTE